MPFLPAGRRDSASYGASYMTQVTWVTSLAM